MKQLHDYETPETDANTKEFVCYFDQVGSYAAESKDSKFGDYVDADKSRDLERRLAFCMDMLFEIGKIAVLSVDKLENEDDASVSISDMKRIEEGAIMALQTARAKK